MKQEYSNNYIEIGEAEEFPAYGSKQERIRTLSEMGLIVPPTFVIKPDAEEEMKSFTTWAKDQLKHGMEFMIRTDISGIQNARNMPSIRDATTDIKDIWRASLDFIKESETGVVIIQALSPNSINEDILSANFQIAKDPFTGILSAKVEACPDIAPLINRMNLTPTFILPPSNEMIINNHDLLWDVILYRVGRDIMRKSGVKLPKIEELPDEFQDRYKDTIEVGKVALKDSPEKFPAPAYWAKIISSQTSYTPEIKDSVRNVLIEERNRVLKKVARYKPTFDRYITLKMSFIGSDIENLVPVYWDIVERE